MLASGNKPDAPLIQSRDELVAHIEQGAKPKSEWRIGTEHERFVFYREDLQTVPYEGPARHPRSRRHAPLRLGAGRGRREHHRLSTRREAARSRWSPAASSSFGRAAEERAPDLRRSEPPSEAGPRSGEPSSASACSASGFSPSWSLDETPLDAQGPLRHHAALHAEGRQARPRHDVPHLHGAGEPGFRRRSRHGEEIPRRRWRCSRWRPRCSPIRRSPKASPTVFCPIAAISGPTPTTTAPACCLSSSRRAWASSAMSITRSMCRCISSIATAKYIDVAGKSFRDFLDGKMPAAAGRAADHRRLGGSSDHRLPRSAAEAFLEMRGADGGPWRRSARCPRSGWGFSTISAPRCRLGHGQGLDGGRTPAASQRGSPARPANCFPQGDRARYRAPRARYGRQRIKSPRLQQPLR